MTHLNKSYLETYYESIGLTASERKVLVELLKGCTNKQISETLQLAQGTVKFHLGRIFIKTEISNRQELSVHLLRIELEDCKQRLAKALAHINAIELKESEYQMSQDTGAVEQTPVEAPAEEKKKVEASIVTGVLKDDEASEETETKKDQ